MNTASWYALTHQHAGTRGGFEHVVYTFNLESRAFLVAASTDHLRYTFALGARDVLVEVGGIGRRTKIGLAADKKDGDGWTADGAHFFYPLFP